MDPIDVILSLLPSLNDKEKQQVRMAIGMPEHPCFQKGHAYKLLGHSPGGWFKSATSKLFCPKCGNIMEIPHG